MKLLQHINSAARTVVHKSGAAVRFATGMTGDIVATGTNIVGGTIAITGGVIAAVGVGTYAGGVAIMGAADKLADKSQAMADKAYDDLMSKAPAPAAQEETMKDEASHDFELPVGALAAVPG